MYSKALLAPNEAQYTLLLCLVTYLLTQETYSKRSVVATFALFKSKL